MKVLSKSDHYIKLQDEFGQWSADAKWDGCVDFYQYANTPITMRKEGETDPCDDYTHICSINSFIKILQDIQKEQVTLSAYSGPDPS